MATPPKKTTAEMKAIADKQAADLDKPKKKAPPKKAAAKKKPAAKKKTAVLSKEDETRNNEKLSTSKNLKNYFTDLMDMKLAVNEANGRLRNYIKQLLGKEDWHKGAFADVRKIAGMNSTARADYLRTFKPLYEAMCFTDWDPELKDLLTDLENEGGPMEEPSAASVEQVDTEAEQGNVKTFPGAKTATKPVEEESFIDEPSDKAGASSK